MSWVKSYRALHRTLSATFIYNVVRIVGVIALMICILCNPLVMCELQLTLSDCCLYSHALTGLFIFGKNIAMMCAEGSAMIEFRR